VKTKDSLLTAELLFHKTGTSDEVSYFNALVPKGK